MSLLNNLTKSLIAFFLVLSSMASVAAGGERTGSFSGLNNHVTSGMVSVVINGDNAVIELGEDFTFDGAPDPKIALGKDGEYDPATLIEPLRSNSGAQSYAVPAGINVADYNEVYIWCERYSVGLGVAGIQ